MTVRPFAISPVIVGLALLGSARSAAADSDGYYCTGPNYIAYETSFSRFASAHYLYLIRLGDSVGIARTDSLPLALFQVHGMRCGPGSLQLLGWDSLYTIHIGNSDLSLTAALAPWANQGSSRESLADYPSVNLGAWSVAARAGRADTIPLAIDAKVYRFILATEVRPTPNVECSQTIVTRLVELDQVGRTVESRLAFRWSGAEGVRRLGRR